MISFGFGENNLTMLKNIASDLGIEDLIEWIGGLEYDDMPSYYNAADLVISIPDSDSSPKTVYEAMFCKKPVIVSDLDWVYEILGDKNCIIKVDHKNNETIRDSILKLYEDHNYKKQLSDNALRVSKQFFDYHENMSKMESIMISEIKDD